MWQCLVVSGRQVQVLPDQIYLVLVAAAPLLFSTLGPTPLLYYYQPLTTHLIIPQTPN